MPIYLARLVDVGFYHLVEHAHRQREKDGPLRRSHRDLHGAAPHSEQLRAVEHPDRPLGDRPGDLGEVTAEEPVERLEPRIHLSGEDDHGCETAVRLVEHRHRIAQADRRVDLDHGGPVGNPCVAVGHPGHDRLLQPEDVTDLGVITQGGEEALLDRSWVPEDHIHLIADELAE